MNKNKLVASIMPYLICILAALFYVYDYFIQVSPAVITNQLMSAFNIGASGLSVLSACFFYAYASMQIPAGILLDRFGARRLLSVAIMLSGFGVLLFGMTHSFALAGFARFCIGFGSAFAFISTLFLASRWFEHQYFALIAGLVQFAGCLGSIMGEAPLAHVIDTYGWRHTMITTGLMTTVLALFYWLVIRDHRPGVQIREVVQGKGFTHEWNRLKEVLRISQVWWIALAGFFCWVPVATLGALWGVPYLMKSYDWTNTKAAGFCSLFWIALGLSSPLIGWWSNKIKNRRLPCQICFTAGLTGGVMIIFAPHLPVLVTGFALILLGTSAAVQSLTFGIIKDILPAAIFGTASGFTNMMAILAGGVSQQLVGILLALTWAHEMLNGVPFYQLYNYQVAIVILPISALLGLWISLFKLRETHCEQSYPESEAESICHG
ncbi:MAG: MFS transporter [Legionellales bacterium]|nr:MFS transporter [Legionellales bacterium]